MKKHLLLLLFLPLFGYSQYDIDLEMLANGYNNPIEIVNAGDERLFVVEQAGRIRILYTDGTKVTTPFLDIASQVSSGGERGLLGLAFPPDYCTSGRFYVNYTYNEGDQLKTRISRFSVNPDNENDALEDSEEPLIEFNQPFSNHNGGQVEFGPDGYLYIATGDGGAGGDPQNYAQNISMWLGKLLRIDVSGDTGYTSPEDNPYIFEDFGLDEIWAFGLRNPWKFAFDSETGDLYIADVGQNAVEEVNFQAADYEGGANYGWRCFEGTADYDLSECADIVDFVHPVFEYNQSGTGRCSVTGGRVYRGNSFGNLVGKYILTDLCSGEYWLLWQEEGGWENFYGGNLSGGLVAFGSDVWGEMYAARNGNGTIYRVVESSGELLDHIVFENSNTIKSTLEGVVYTWYLNDTLIEGENSQTLEVSENGDYHVVITSETGCEITSNTLNVIISDIHQSSAIKYLRLFPNPTANVLNIELETQASFHENITTTIYSIDGKKVMEFQLSKSDINTSVNVDALNSGIYFLVLKNASGEVLASRKLAIN